MSILRGGTFDESPLRRPKPYVRTRGSPASMALERLPPKCVAGRGDGHRGDVGYHAGGWGRYYVGGFLIREYSFPIREYGRDREPTGGNDVRGGTVTDRVLGGDRRSKRHSKTRDCLFRTEHSEKDPTRE